jgi:hypothetical protein
MARVTLAPNYQAVIQPQLLPAVRAEAEALAADARGFARGVAWGPGSYGTHYADEIKAGSGLQHGYARGWIQARKFTSRWLEHGTKNMPAKHVMERFARQSGQRFRP